MIPVNQTTFNTKGNCFEACIASMLEIDLNQVPFFSKDNWYKECNEWLHRRGLGLIIVDVCKKGLKMLFE